MLDISNYYEQLVADQLWKLIESSTETLSQGFLDDVACLALNQLPPCYVRNPIDKGIGLSDQQYQEMLQSVDIAIANAAEKVRQHPHDIRD